jgi:hypothetical protein
LGASSVGKPPIGSNFGAGNGGSALGKTGQQIFNGGKKNNFNVQQQQQQTSGNS